ncbi:MAG: hypothetical protein ACKVP3_03310 [Hyphomicrobiaceae bacterium]
MKVPLFAYYAASANHDLMETAADTALAGLDITCFGSGVFLRTMEREIQWEIRADQVDQGTHPAKTAGVSAQAA